MIDEWDLSDRNRQLLSLAILAVLLTGVATVVYAATFDVVIEDQGRLETDSGLEVHHINSLKITSGNPFVDANTIRLENETGAATYSASVDTVARVDKFNGSYSKVSQLDVSNGNLTINPDDMNRSKIQGAQLDRFNYTGEATVGDGDIDLRYGGNGGQAQILIDSNGTQGKAYGLVDVDTGDAKGVAIANSSGTLYFDNAEVESNQQRISVEDIGTLEIRQANRPHSLIKGADIQAKFFTSDGARIINRTDDNNDGQIDLAGFPVDDEFIVVVDHPDYHQRASVIQDTSQQSRIFLLNDSATVNDLDIEFQLQDETGDFDASTTRVLIERPINSSEYKPSVPAEDFVYRVVAGDDIGADSRFETILEKDERYRITVTSQSGNTRQLGSFTPKDSGIVPLDIGTIQAQQEVVEDVRYSANRTEINGSPHIVVQYNDSRQLTDTLYVEIYEWRNESNNLKTNTSFSGPLGTVSVTEPIPQSENQTEWVAKVTADRGGAENINIERPTSPRNNFLPAMPTWLVTLISIGTIWIVAGAFSQVNGDVGALVVSGLGGLFYVAGFTPPTLGAGVVILSLVTAGLIFVHERSAGGSDNDTNHHHRLCVPAPDERHRDDHERERVER
jgi:hypothetical protein